MTKTIVHWTEDMNIQSRHPLAQLYGIDKTILLSTRRRLHAWTFTKSSSAHALIIVLVFILKNHFIVLVLIRSRLIMTKTFVHWTEDMIQSRHRLAQLYGILRIALRSCYWQNHFIEYSCYLQNHLWTTAELTVDNRLSPYARNALHRYVINLSSNVLFPTYTYLWSWQCSYWLKISRCKNVLFWTKQKILHSPALCDLCIVKISRDLFIFIL
jgi:hypothetical protein